MRCARCSTCITGALTAGHPRELLEQAAFALLDYVESSPTGSASWSGTPRSRSRPASFASLISDIATQVEHILVAEFKARGFDPKLAPMYAQMLVGMVALTGQWWLDARKPEKADVAAHLVNLAWNGLSGLEAEAAAAGRRPALSPTSVDCPVDQHDADPAPDLGAGAGGPAGRRHPRSTAQAAPAAPAGSRAGRRRSTAGGPGGRVVPGRRRRRAAASRAASASRSSTSRPGCALRAGRKSSSTPRCSSTPADRNQRPAARRERRRLGHLGHAEHVAVEGAQRVLATRRAPPADVVQAHQPAHPATSAARCATAKIRRNGSTVPHGRCG